jgi:hypothetical protein
MRTLLSVFSVLTLFLCFTTNVDADFELVRKIPAPVMACESGIPLIKAMGSDGNYLFLTRGCYADGGARVARINPADGTIVNEDYWDYPIPDCEGSPMPTSASYCPYDGGFYVGTDCGAVVGLSWMSPDSAYAFTSYLVPELDLPGGMAPGEYADLLAADQIDAQLARFECTGYPMTQHDLIGVEEPVAMAEYGGNMFVVDAGQHFIMEVDLEGAPVDTHYVEGWGDFLTQGTAPEAATFFEGQLYLAGNSDSIFVYDFAEQQEYTEPVPEGDSVEVVVIPEELVMTFDTVSDSGDVDVVVSETDDCDPPAGVTLFPEYYDIETDASFEYITEVAVFDSVFPEGVERGKLRVFSRRSDSCRVWRDVTVAPVEDVPVLKILSRSRSEDDEFSIFALGEDNRTPKEVVEYKIADLRGHIQSAHDSIPGSDYDRLLSILHTAESDYYRGRSSEGAEEVSGIESVVRDAPSIPHTYDPQNPGRNVAGRIISRSHTLEFSLNYSDETKYASGAVVVPGNIVAGIAYPWIRVFIEVPADLDPSEVDVDHVYLENVLQAVPESVRVFDYDSDSENEIRALFPGRGAAAALVGSGCNDVANVSCFVSGYELHSVGNIEITEPVAHVAAEAVLLSGTTSEITWRGFACDGGAGFRLAYSVDGGLSWQEIAAGIEGTAYEWEVPGTETEAGLLRVSCDGAVGEGIVAYSDLITIQSGAGVDVEPAPDFRLALRPNPSRSGVEIEFASPAGRSASIAVYSVRGELVKTVFNGMVAEGLNRIVWQGDNSGGQPVSAGTYFVVFRTGVEIATEKLILQR